MIELHSASHHVEYLEYGHVWRSVRQLKIKEKIVWNSSLIAVYLLFVVIELPMYDV